MADVAIIMGSDSDTKAVKDSGMMDIFQAAQVTRVVHVFSAHRHLDDLKRVCVEAVQLGAMAFIGIAGKNATLPGVISAAVNSRVPVLGVFLAKDEMAALVGMGKMADQPAGCPVAVMGYNGSGLKNAAIMASAIVSRVKDDPVPLHKALEALGRNKPSRRDITVS